MGRFSFCSLWAEPFCLGRPFPATSIKSAVLPHSLQTLLTVQAIAVMTSHGRGPTPTPPTSWCHVVLVFTPTPPSPAPNNLAYPIPMHCHQPNSCCGIWPASNEWEVTQVHACVCSNCLACVLIDIFSMNNVTSYNVLRCMCTLSHTIRRICVILSAMVATGLATTVLLSLLPISQKY